MIDTLSLHPFGRVETPKPRTRIILDFGYVDQARRN
jgi:hypothetical protein